MLNAALDATVLVSAFLTRGGVSDELLRHARAGAFIVFLSEDILAEVVHTLAYPRIRRRYPYIDEDVRVFCDGLREAASLVSTPSDLPSLQLCVIQMMTWYLLPPAPQMQRTSSLETLTFYPFRATKASP